MSTFPAEGSIPGLTNSSKFAKRAEGIFADKFEGRDENKQPVYVPTFVCARLEVKANVRDIQTDAHYRVLRFKALNNELKELLIPDRLIGDRNLISLLREAGLQIGTDPWCAAQLHEYINEADHIQWRKLVTKIGWQSDTEYAFPDHISGEPRYGYYESAYIAPNADHPFKQAGSPTDWRANIGRNCIGNDRLIHAVCCGLAGPLLKLAQEPYIGSHFVGGSSSGKSTALIVGGSTNGRITELGFIRQWRATSNAIEGIAELHNDALLPLDELRQVSAKEVSEIIYMLGNNQGKGRSEKDASLKKTRNFRVVLLSSGEESLEARMNAAGMEIKRGGQDVRFIEIPSDAGLGLGLFQDLHGAKDGAEFSLKLRSDSLKYYGTPLRSFVHNLTDRLKQLDVMQLVEDRHKQIVKGMTLSDEANRVARKFAVLAVAGELASEWTITGWPVGEATRAMIALFNVWAKTRKRPADVTSGMKQVREFIQRFLRSRFNWPNHSVNDAVGFVTLYPQGDGDKEVKIKAICIEPELFSSLVSKGYEANAILRGFVNEGSLETPKEKGRLTMQKTPPFGEKHGVYAFKPGVLQGFRDYENVKTDDTHPENQENQ